MICDYQVCNCRQVKEIMMCDMLFTNHFSRNEAIIVKGNVLKSIDQSYMLILNPMILFAFFLGCIRTERPQQ